MWSGSVTACGRPSRPDGPGLLTLTVTLVTATPLFYATVKGRGLLDAAYSAVVTIATIGCGDLMPKTAAGKIFTMAYVICGIGIFVAAGALGAHIADRASRS